MAVWAPYAAWTLVGLGVQAVPWLLKLWSGEAEEPEIMQALQDLQAREQEKATRRQISSEAQREDVEKLFRGFEPSPLDQAVMTGPSAQAANLPEWVGQQGPAAPSMSPEVQALMQPRAATSPLVRLSGVQLPPDLAGV